MAPTKGPVTDPQATGPRSVAEYEICRRAHWDLRHPAARHAADEIRLRAVMAAYHADAALETARAALETAQTRADAVSEEPRSPDETDPLAELAAALTAAEEKAFEARAAVPDVGPCPIDRCTGHAKANPCDIRRYLRTSSRPLRIATALP